jgi:hypothetical protein
MTLDVQKLSRLCPIRRTNDDERLIYAEVYAPNTLDTYGEFMLEDDIKKMAHRFMKLDLSKTIDTNHDNIPNGSHPVESFIARADDPDFTEGAWVLGVHVPDDIIWKAIKSGELNCYSFEAMVRPVEYKTAVSVIRDHVGVTKKAEDDKGTDHHHTFFVQVDQTGVIRNGMTSPGPDGHVHRIAGPSRTERAGADNHNHRFDLF